jgi:hypothetical protein
MKENGAKMQATQEYTLHSQRLNCEANVYELEDHVGEKGWNSN